MKTSLEQFTLNGINYYYHKGKYWSDNMTVRQVITEKEYRRKLTDYYINKYASKIASNLKEEGIQEQFNEFEDEFGEF